MKTYTYRWREPFNEIYHTTQCEIISQTDKTALVRLLGFGPKGLRPGTKTRIHLKSLADFVPEKKTFVPDWHRYTD